MPYYCAAIRADAWDAVGGYHPGLDGVDESVVIWLRLTREHDVRMLPDVLARYRIREDSLSRDAAKVEGFEDALERSFLSARPLDDRDDERALTQNLAREWAPYNVRVNALRPGFFPTEWSMKHFIDEDRKAKILGHTPMGRFGRPDELIGAVLWLASDAASFVTGSIVAVDGGFTAMTI